MKTERNTVIEELKHNKEAFITAYTNQLRDSD